MRNRSVVLDEDPSKIASSHYLDRCLLFEDQYNTLRKNLPSYLEGARDFMNEIESTKYCEKAFDVDDSAVIEPCKKAMNGLLSKGISNTI